MNNNLETNLRIMIVDDSSIIRKTTADILRKANYDVVAIAASALEAMDLIVSTSPNLIIVDVVMPEQSGLELARLLKTKMRDLSVIAMSSLNDNQIIVEAISSGASDFLVKPFEPNDLLKSVQKIKQIREQAV